MNMNVEELLKTVLDSFSEFDYIRTGDIPTIDLYMDQVTTFMDSKLKNSTRNPEEDKILTKTMINNYAKNDLLPPPTKKKYSKEHLLVLTFIYYFKNILSMKDIQMVLGPITEKYFESTGSINVARVYDEVCAFELERTKILQKDIEVMYNNSLETFLDVPEEDREMLQQFSFICTLSLDVYVKKLLIEKLIDELLEPQEEKKKK